MQQKHLAQSGCSTLSALFIFNTLCVFTEKPIREQEIKLECMYSTQRLHLATKCSSRVFVDNHKILCHEVNSWSSVALGIALLLIYQKVPNAHALEKWNAHVGEQCK